MSLMGMAAVAAAHSQNMRWMSKHLPPIPLDRTSAQRTFARRPTGRAEPSHRARSTCYPDHRHSGEDGTSGDPADTIASGVGGFLAEPRLTQVAQRQARHFNHYQGRIHHEAT
ncbi:hypothetical protein XAB3213_4570004 [Xanthomonas citri pv. bilvae]|nr:hypothetical protein XAB3213_270040 [Xanthomonas citri pv. bilvae]CEJ48942.1 hypothetical protein XAB3213_4570004 [Xanthomonas citri pv. bilvae]